MLKAYMTSNRYEAGCDEAGRGCLAGPVYAAAVILDDNFPIHLLDDSKKLNATQRASLRPIIKSKAKAWAVAYCTPKEIDRYNILQASIRAMHKAIKKLSINVEYLIIDGNKFNPICNIPFSCIVQGDAKYASIAAASILAKTYRDDYMCRLHKKYPEFGWNNNKGYPTQIHRQAIVQYGHTKYHRRSFKLYPIPTLFDQHST